MSNQESHPEQEEAREFTVQVYLQKPWSVEILFDSISGQYEVSVPELSVATCATSRSEASWVLEDCLATYFATLFDRGELGKLPEPRIYHDKQA